MPALPTAAAKSNKSVRAVICPPGIPGQPDLWWEETEQPDGCKAASPLFEYPGRQDRRPGLQGIGPQGLRTKPSK